MLNLPVRGLGFDDGSFLLPECLEYRFHLSPATLSLESAQTLRGLLGQIAAARAFRPGGDSRT